MLVFSSWLSGLCVLNIRVVDDLASRHELQVDRNVAIARIVKIKRIAALALDLHRDAA